jgi:MFS family permease
MFGKAYTLFRIKPLFAMSIAVYQIGNTLATFAPTSASFIVGRAITGFGCAGMVAGLFTTLTRSFPLRQRPLVGGIAGGVETLACLAAPLVGGALIDGWTWRACYGINIPLGISGLLVILFALEVPHPPNVDRPWREKLVALDLLGTAVFVPALACLLLALQWGGTTYGWTNTRIIVLFVLFVVLLTLFGWSQYRSREKATLPLRILRNRSILAGAWFAFCCNATLAVVEYYMSIYFQGVLGDSAFQSGIYALPMIAGMCIAGVITGAATSWFGFYTPYMYVSSVLGPVAVGFLTQSNLETDLVKTLCFLGLLGAAVGGSLQIPQFAAQTVLSPNEVTIGYAIVQFGSQLGPVLSLSASSTLFANRLKAEVLKYAPEINATTLDNTGLTDIRTIIGGDRLGQILLGYDAAVTQTLYFPLALTCMTIFGSLAMEWRSVKKNQ